MGFNGYNRIRRVNNGVKSLLSWTKYLTKERSSLQGSKVIFRSDKVPYSGDRVSYEKMSERKCQKETLTAVT